MNLKNEIKMGLDTKIKWHKPVKKWKPNLIQRLLIRLKIIRDKRYNGKPINWMELDEVGHYPRYIKGLDDWKVKK